MEEEEGAGSCVLESGFEGETGESHGKSWSHHFLKAQ